MRTRIVIDGRVYASGATTPDGVRPAREQAGERSPRTASGEAFEIAAETAAPATEPKLARALVGSLLRQARRHDSRGSRDAMLAALERTSRVLESFLAALLGVVAVAVLAGGVTMLTRMGASERSQGGRFYVAVAVVVALGCIHSQAVRLAERRWGSAGLFGASSPAARRFAIVSTLALALAAALVVGLALLLP